MSTEHQYRRRTAVLMAASVVVTAAACAPDRGASAQGSAENDFPTKSIRLVVQAAAGGGSDTTARALAKELERELGQNVIVENRTGAAGSTALRYVGDQKPDGYTLGYMPVELSIYPYVGYDIDFKDYDLIGQVVNIPGVIAVPYDSPYRSLEDLIEAASSKKITVANAGTGGVWDAATRGLADASDAEFTRVPFDGDAPAIAAVMGDKVDAVVAGAPAAITAHQDRQLRILAVYNAQPLSELPDVPTVQSLGYDLDFGGWGGLGAAKGLSPQVMRTLEKAVHQASSSKGYQDIVKKMSADAVYRGSKEFTRFVNSQYRTYGAILGEDE